MSVNNIENNSPFLKETHRWIIENAFAFVIDQAGYEVSPGHCLVCPKRLVLTVFDMQAVEWDAVRRLLEEMKGRLDRQFQPDGYNIGINCGEAAGQTVPHAHVHLIPRFKGDHPSPRGGVRAVIPEMAAPASFVDLRVVIVDLLEWAAQQGGWEAKVWQVARDAVRPR